MIKFKKFLKWFVLDLFITLSFFYSLDKILDYSDKSIFIVTHSPLIIQLILSFFVCRLKWKNSFSKYILLSTILFVIICVYYNLNFVNTKHYPEDFSIKLIYLEIIFQIYLLILMSIFYMKKKISKEFLLNAFKIMLPTFIIIFIWIVKVFSIVQNFLILGLIIMFIFVVNIFNPILIYILSSMANGELLLNDGKENEKKSNIKIE